MAIQKVIFDVGQVLVKFNPRNLFIKILKDEEKVDFFLKNICTWEWHIQQDLIYDHQSKELRKKHPEYNQKNTSQENLL